MAYSVVLQTIDKGYIMKHTFYFMNMKTCVFFKYLLLREFKGFRKCLLHVSD